MKKIITASNYEVIPLDARTNVRFYTSIDPGSYVPSHWHDAIEIISNYKLFRRMFFSHFGCTPTEVRKCNDSNYQ